jgi:tRNA A-37 threonylcarbamoyl transferase component Bud32
VAAKPGILHVLRRAGVLASGERARATRLSGGVSSDVYRLETDAGVFCVKAALPALRVAADWQAPVERSHAEVEWLRTVRPIVGDAAPEVLAEARKAHLFVMTFYPPVSHPVWKAELAAGRVDVGFAGAVGELVGRIHAGARGPAVAARFQTGALFEALRLAPYLRHTAERHPDLRAALLQLADRTAATRLALVHGDVSPKNILRGPCGPVLLDAECAWFGDPAFDLAFCATHLLLKAVWRPDHADAYGAALQTFVGAYLRHVDWEPAGGLEARATRLTAALLLARIDGKSPVEYLTLDQDRDFVRDRARRWLAGSPESLEEIANDWRRGLARR